MNYKNQMVSCLKYQAAFFFFRESSAFVMRSIYFLSILQLLDMPTNKCRKCSYFRRRVCHTLHLCAVFFLYIFRDAFISLSAVFKVGERHLSAGLKCITYVCKTHRRPR